MASTDDSLRRYRSKRNFSITSEPAEGGEIAPDALKFVVQKHWARRLHYDFRLALDGTMKSWAIPKGPSFDPKDKRMAVHVEDHPIAYASFEGTIPAKQYGAGKVIIWDTGTWHPIGDPRAGYREGHLKFVLRGHKLHGRWLLIRMKGKSQKQEPWLLIKENDEFVRPASEFSVVDDFPQSVKSLPAPASTNTVLPSEATRCDLPPKLVPQLATLVNAPPSDPHNWVYEIKFDGYRLLTRADGTDIKLFTRNGNDWTARLAPLRKAIVKLKLPSGWYDGEIVLPNESGLPDFGALQLAFDSPQTRNIVLYLFDVPFFAGHDLRAVPLDARRALLKSVLEKISSPQVRFSDAFDAPLPSVLASACKLGLEGVIAKRRTSRYVSSRSPDWIKLKCSQRQEFVIVGYTDPQGTRSGIGALLLGVNDHAGALRYAGKVGSGFTQRTLQNLKRQLEALSTVTSPLTEPAAIEGTPHWVTPRLIAEVSFGEWTRGGRIRHGVFHGLRTDIAVKSIVRERATRARKTVKPARNAAQEPSHALSSRLRVTHPERVIDASTGITKIELIRYYALIGDLMMAHLKGRPVSLVRAPGGVQEELFFQKHAETEKLPGIRQLDSASDSNHAPMLEVASRKGLLSAAQWNVVEFHTLNARSNSLQHPDRMVFDLDPGQGVPWTSTQEGAKLVQAFLEQLGLTAFLKTSGGKGLHIVVPVRRVHDWNTIKGFSQAIVNHLATTIPQRFVAKSGPKNRVGKIFIDYLRNGPGATTVCAWSARARPGLGISVPLAWGELESLRGADHWNVRTVHTRLDTGNTVWDGYSKSARSLTDAMKRLGYAPDLPRSQKAGGA